MNPISNTNVSGDLAAAKMNSYAGKPRSSTGLSIATGDKGGTPGVSTGLNVAASDKAGKSSASADLISAKMNSSAGKPRSSADLNVATGDKGGNPIASTGLNIAASDKVTVSSASKWKSIVSDDVEEVIAFSEFGPHDGEVRFKLIHFWEAWNPKTKVLIGLEMLLIDEKGTAIQGFIPEGRIETYLRHMKAGATYRINKFFGSRSKTVYRVADPMVTLSFSWNTVLSDLKDSSVQFPEDRFRIHGHKEFKAAADKRGDLYDYIGHIKLVNGDVPNDKLQLDETEITLSRRVELHVQTHDEPVMKMYLWDKPAIEFCKKFKASGGPASVILVTTLNPKCLGGVLSISSMAASRVFVDNDIQETRLYLSWLRSNLDVANRINATAVIKHETVTLGDLFSYMKQTSAKVASFECTATIDDVVRGARWYYIGCGECHSKAIKGSTTLMCKKCGKKEIVGVPQYLSRLNVYDQKDQAVFVVLGDAGEELTGKKASELVENYYQANEIEEEDHIVPVPQALIGTIGQTHKFIVQVSAYNLTGKSQTFTVTKVLPIQTPVIEDNIGGKVGEEPGNEGDDQADVSVKRGADMVESEASKCAKCG